MVKHVFTIGRFFLDFYVNSEKIPNEGMLIVLILTKRDDNLNSSRGLSPASNTKKQSFADVLRNRCSYKFHRKTTVLEFLLLKRDSNTGVFL